MKDLKDYIVCMQDTELYLVGPFATMSELSAWGHKWQMEHGDDPRWQSIRLDLIPNAQYCRLEIRKP